PSYNDGDNCYFSNSTNSLRQLIAEYSRLTQSLFALLDVPVEGKVAPAPPKDIMKQIVQLDAKLMGAVEKSMSQQILGEEQNKATMNAIQNLLEDQDQKQDISADAPNYTSAPPNFKPQDPNQPFEPPYSREINMRARILNQQHIPAAALVSLDGGVMPGTTGQPVTPTPQQLQQQQQVQQAQTASKSWCRWTQRTIICSGNKSS
ncbi:hypothetical protein EDD21DRAFT_389076, partial [Dissophora ornata]